MGNAIVVAATTHKSSGSYYLLFGVIILFGLLYFVTIRPQRNRQRQAMQTQREVLPGSRVRTTAGMYATVVSVEDQDVVLEIAPGVKVRFLRRAIMNVVPDNTGTGFAEPSPDSSAPSDEADDDAATG